MGRVFIVCLVVLCAASHKARGQALVRVGETWRFFKARDARSMVRPGWQFPSFNDSRWENSPSGYVFDDPKASALLRPGRHPGYGYLRKKFTLSHPDAIKSLVLRVEFERAFVAYLNGTEIAREPQPGAVRLALQTEIERGFPSSPNGQFDISRFISLLKPGENLLALEGPFSNEGSAAVPLTASLLANFTRGPFIQNSTTNSLQIFWRTALAGNSTVFYGIASNLNQRRFSAQPVTDHLLTLTNLSPGQTYFYRVETETEAGLLRSEPARFQTLRRSGPIQFIVMGDSGQGTSGQWNMAKVIREANPDLVLHCGDLVYQGFNDRTVDWRLFNYYQPHMASTPYFMAVGNHDLNCCVGDGAPDYSPTNWFLNATNFQNSFYLPTNTITGTEHFYSFDAADAHFVALYNPWFADYDFTRDKSQLEWLINDLAESHKPWKFIFMHMPLATSGGHYNRDDNTNTVNDSAELMNLLLPVAQKYGVQLVLGGHDHNFERFAPTNGVHHLVTGGGGGTVYDIKQRHPASAQFWATNHCTRVTVSNETALIEALDWRGAVFDSFVIHRQLASSAPFESTWHTPRFPVRGRHGEDGNFPGQQFDLAGEGIPTRSGEWSNLGRVYFNNDETYFYIGLRDVMTYGDCTVYVFVESPGKPGVVSLSALGNGLADPHGQGADGLDFLENLSFTNFAPAIGCILGDEFADGQMPEFKRPLARMALGQGVFFLDPDLRPVGGALVQQFNRSPESLAVPDESNADFIEVAIPYAALGSPKAGDLLKVAVVVAGGEVDASRQTQPLDKSALAILFEGNEKTVIEGVRVRLAGPSK